MVPGTEHTVRARADDHVGREADRSATRDGPGTLGVGWRRGIDRVAPPVTALAKPPGTSARRDRGVLPLGPFQADPGRAPRPAHRAAVHLAVARRVPRVQPLPGAGVALLQLHELQDPAGAALDRARQLHRDCSTTRSSGSPWQHPLPDGGRRARWRSSCPRDRPAPQPEGDPRDRGLPDDLLSAGGHPRRRRRDPVDLPAQSHQRPGQPVAQGGRHRRAGLVLRPGVGQERDHPDDDLGRRRRRDHLSRRAPGRVARALRGRRGRRCRGVGEAPPRDDPDDQPGDPLQPDHRGDRDPSSPSRRPT